MCLPLISQMTQMNPKRQNNNNHKTNLATNCLYLRNNAACCIPYLRNQRYLRENNHMRVLKLYCTNETPMSPADLADDADKPQNQDYKIATITRTTTCLSLRDNAACCIPLRNQRYLRENNTQEYSINPHKRNPNISRRSRR